MNSDEKDWVKQARRIVHIKSEWTLLFSNADMAAIIHDRTNEIIKASTLDDCVAVLDGRTPDGPVEIEQTYIV